MQSIKSTALLLTLTFCVFVAINPAFSQSQINLDSLTAVLNKYPKDDTAKARVLIDFGHQLRRGTNSEVGFAYNEKALAILENAPAPILKAEALHSKAAYLEAQSRYDEAIDLLQKALAINNNVNSKKQLGDNYLLLGWIAYDKSEGENAKKYYEQALDLSEQIGNIDIKLTALNGLGLAYTQLFDIYKAISYYERAIDLARKNNKGQAESRSLSNLANSHHSLGNHAKAIEFTQTALRLKENRGDLYSITYSYLYLSDIHSSLGEYDKAMDYQKKALAMAQKTGNAKIEALAYHNIGNCYKDLGKYDEALLNMEKYREIMRSRGLFDDADAYVGSIGDVYALMSRKVEAHRYYQESITMTRKTKHQSNLAASLLDVASQYASEPDSLVLQMGVSPTERYSKGLVLATEAMEIAVKIKTPNRMIYALRVTSILHEKNKDYVLAYDTYKKYITLKDSIYGEQVKKQVARKEIQYEFDKKETELKYEQQLTAEQLEKQKLLTVQGEQALTLNQQNLTLKEQALTLSNKEKDLAHLAYLKEQAEKQEKTQELSLSQEREKGKERDLSLKNVELSAQQKQNFYWGLLAAVLFGGLGISLYFYSLLKKKNTTISQQNELNEHTIAILSHDIKEPLLGVKLMLKKLNKDDPFVEQASKSLEGQINAVNGILTNLLKMKKLSLLKKDKNVKANAQSVVQNVVTELSVVIQTKSLTIQNDLPEDVLLPIAPEKLQIIIHNLLSNAVKYSFPNQKIRIFKEGKGVSIQDFGVGLSPEQRSKLMREVTASQQGTNAERGNGLGLFLVGAMLQGENIKVVFDSPEVGGTIVKVLG